jgi:hypothetical protein
LITPVLRRGLRRVATGVKWRDPCHHAAVLPYAAYLRVYEPVSVLSESERTRWTAYADSVSRPKRVNALGEEHAQALRRLLSPEAGLVPAAESSHAYVRRAAGEIYVCPWQSRLRSWVSAERLLAEAPAGLVAAGAAVRLRAELERWRERQRSIRPYIRSSTWHIPFEWFVPFIPEERWLVLGTPGGSASSGSSGSSNPAASAASAALGSGPLVAAPARTLLYVTSMAYARRRMERAARALEKALEKSLKRSLEGSWEKGPEKSLQKAPEPAGCSGGGMRPADERIFGRVAEVSRWLTEFHPRSLVELDYGGLVHLLDDRTLCADQSVGEIRAAVVGLERGEEELTTAMYSRVLGRWRRIRALETAN